MKLLKKFSYLLILTTAFASVSCGSKPKNSDITDATLNEQVQNEQNEEPEVSEENLSGENADAENLSDLEEALTDDQIAELPELPAEPEETAEEAPEEPVIAPEPIVKDEPVLIQQEGSADNQEDPEVESDGLSVHENSIQEESESAAASSLNKTQNEQTASEESNSDAEAPAEDNAADIAEEKPEPGKVEVIPNPSRSFTIKKNQLIDIVYPGKGWIYQGNIDENGNIDSRNRNFVFGGRKLGGKDQSFTLRSRAAGTFLLHFYKNDMLTGNYIDDYLEIIVEDKNSTDTSHILAPSYAEVVPPKASITAEKLREEKRRQQLAQEELADRSEEDNKSAETKQASSTRTQEISKQPVSPAKETNFDTIIQTTESAPNENSPAVKTGGKASDKSAGKKNPAVTKDIQVQSENSDNLDNLDSDQLLTEAQKLYSEKQYPKALSAINKFFGKASNRLDEGLFLQGQILEEKSPVQNIKDAIEAYDLVVKNYPASSLWDKANKRSIFLKRFYINIR